MWRLLLIFALCGSASAVVPLHSCTSAAFGTSQSCNIPSVGQHHLIVAVMWTNGDTNVLSYTDSAGNSFSQNPFFACYPTGPACNTGVGVAQSYSISFAPRSAVLFYSSTGTFSGSDTFTVSNGDFVVDLYVAEYDQDLINADTGNQGNSPATSQVTTTGANDLIISIAADSGTSTCNFTAPASGFTIEYNPANRCMNYADRINLTPGTYTAGSTASGAAAIGYSTIAFGVAPFTSGAVRHARNQY